MTKTERPESLFPEITADLKDLFGSGLISIILYGSAATPDYRPGKSDVNLLVVLSDEGKDSLGRMLPLIGSWKKKGLAAPLIMTEREIRASLDVFPLEFLTMQRHHVPVFGKDVLRDLSFRREHVRLQCERDLRGKIFLLRSGFLDSEGKTDRLRKLIAASLTAVTVLFQGFLFLRDRTIPDTKRAVIEEVNREFAVDGSVFLQCLDIREGTDRPPGEKISEIFSRYLEALDAFGVLIDAHADR